MKNQASSARSNPTIVPFPRDLTSAGKRQTADGIRTIIIHCSATRPGQRASAWDIDDWHRHPSRGYDCIGYHYVIRKDGSIEQGRPEYRTGAHCRGHNTGTLGICLEGGLDSDGKPTSDEYTGWQWESLELLVQDISERLPLVENVKGHCELDNRRDCPCFDVTTWYEEMHSAEDEDHESRVERYDYTPSERRFTLRMEAEECLPYRNESGPTQRVTGYEW